MFMKASDGCGYDSGSTVKLNKSFDGLKKASRSWSPKMVKDLQTCVDKILLVIPIDDVPVICSEEDCDKMARDPTVIFPTKHLRELTWYPGALLSATGRKEY